MPSPTAGTSRRRCARARSPWGNYVAGRVTNQPTIQFAQPIRGQDDRPDGIVLTSIDLTWLARNLSANGLPPDATLTVADRNGGILVRLPDHEAWAGKPLPPAFLKGVSENLGGVIDMEGLRSRTRLTGIAAPNGNDLDGLTVAVGLARDASFADIDAATRRGIVLILAGALLAFAAALLGGRVFIPRSGACSVP